MRVSSNRRPRGGRTNSGNNRTGTNAPRSGPNNNRRPNTGNRNYDSNGPDGKIRGTATQVYDKYIALATDAHTSGDHVAAENYFQHAEHYFRIMAANNLAQKERQPTEQQVSSENDEDDNSQSSISADRSEGDAASEKRGDNNKKTEEVSLDLSMAEQPVIELPNAIAPVTGSEAAGTEAGVDGEQEKPKRKVSRTRTLRRRTSSRSADEDDKEEVNTTE
ncbi:MAG: DUF4167 domain-containing protein [Sneathiella sp.]|nr:DUF4167 domain-containing protein [Sneathiella sp.]